VPGTRLLDVATGPGHLPARAAERGATPVGVDIADAMVASLKRASRVERGLPRRTWDDIDRC